MKNPLNESSKVEMTQVNSLLVQSKFTQSFVGLLMILLLVCCRGSKGSTEGDTPSGSKPTPGDSSNDGGGVTAKKNKKLNLSCGSGTSLTYENYAQAFFTNYCISCHSSKLAETARPVGTEDMYFDTLDEIVLRRVEILSAINGGDAGDGKDKTTEVTSMPPGMRLNNLEIRMLSEWLECGCPD